MEKRSRPPQGFYKSIETPSIPRRRKCESKPEVLGTFEAERIMAKKILNSRPYYMVKWHGYCASQNTWEPKDHLPADLVEAFENPDPLAFVSVSSCFCCLVSFSKIALYFRQMHVRHAREQIPLIGSQEAEHLIVKVQTLCSVAHKLLSISKLLRRLVGSETLDCFR